MHMAQWHSTKGEADMKGNGEFYLRKTKDIEMQLRKLERAKNKYSNILSDIEKEINDKKEEIKRSIHCYSTCTAETPDAIVR